jgi:hypothetical protein
VFGRTNFRHSYLSDVGFGLFGSMIFDLARLCLRFGGLVGFPGLVSSFPWASLGTNLLILVLFSTSSQVGTARKVFLRVRLPAELIHQPGVERRSSICGIIRLAKILWVRAVTGTRLCPAEGYSITLRFGRVSGCKSLRFIQKYSVNWRERAKYNWTWLIFTINMY